MNTIRRKITKGDEHYPDNEHCLTFEGEAGKFNIFLEDYSPRAGVQRTSIKLDKTDAEVLLKSLQNFLK